MKAFITTIAFVWFIQLMTPRMWLQVRELTKLFRTIHIVAFIWFVASVSPFMLLKMRQLGEFSWTNIAGIGLDTLMNSHVLWQVWWICKRFRALKTFIWFCLTHMILVMVFQFGFRHEYLKFVIGWARESVLRWDLHYLYAYYRPQPEQQFYPVLRTQLLTCGHILHWYFLVTMLVAWWWTGRLCCCWCWAVWFWVAKWWEPSWLTLWNCWWCWAVMFIRQPVLGPKPFEMEPP